MLAVQIVSHEGPAYVKVKDIPPPKGLSELVGKDEVPITISVRAAGVSFPELLQSKGKYQYQPEMPFVPGSEVAGIVESAPEGSGFSRGDRVFAYCQIGGLAETAIAPATLTFPLPDELTFAQGAALFSNYTTAYFALVTRGRAVSGETVVVHGAAGGVGTAILQVAAALGLTTIAVVSNEKKAGIARDLGVAHVLFSDQPWKDQLLELVPGGVDMVTDLVGNQTLDSLRALRETGRLVVVGFASGEIPEVKVNRLLLRNLEVIGAGYGAYAFSKPGFSREVVHELEKMIHAGKVSPVVGATYPIENASEALAHLDSRQAVGKVVLEMGLEE